MRKPDQNRPFALARLRRQAAVRVVELVRGFVVVVHFRKHGDAAIAAATMIMLGEFLPKRPQNAGNDERMLRGQKAAIAARRVDRRLENGFNVDLVAAAVDETFEAARRFVEAVLAGAALAAGFDPQKSREAIRDLHHAIRIVIDHEAAGAEA